MDLIQQLLFRSVLQLGQQLQLVSIRRLTSTVEERVISCQIQSKGSGYGGELSCLIGIQLQSFAVFRVIADNSRNCSLERGDGPCASSGFGSPRFLPDSRVLGEGVSLDIKSNSINLILTQSEIISEHPLPLSTPSNVGVGAFARQAQVSHLLEILMLHLNDYKTHHTMDLEESDQIARTLTAFSLLIPEETPQPWPAYVSRAEYRHYL